MLYIYIEVVVLDRKPVRLGLHCQAVEELRQRGCIHFRYLFRVKAVKLVSAAPDADSTHALK
jgi:hypothetical protein